MVTTNNTNVQQLTRPKGLCLVDRTPQPDLGAQLWGHEIVFDDETVACKRCNEEFVIPEIFRVSRSLHETVYRVYICGQFKHMDCGMDFKERLDDLDSNKSDRISRKPYPDSPHNKRFYVSDNTNTFGSNTSSSDNNELKLSRFREMLKNKTSL